MSHAYFNFHALRDDPRFAGFYSRARGRPSWVWRAAILAALITIVVPVLLLTVAAALAFIAVFIVLSLVHSLLDATRGIFGGWRGGRDRRNVRVIRPD